MNNDVLVVKYYFEQKPDKIQIVTRIIWQTNIESENLLLNLYAYPKNNMLVV